MVRELVRPRDLGATGQFPLSTSKALVTCRPALTQPQAGAAELPETASEAALRCPGVWDKLPGVSPLTGKLPSRADPRPLQTPLWLPQVSRLQQPQAGPTAKTGPSDGADVSGPWRSGQRPGLSSLDAVVPAPPRAAEIIRRPDRRPRGVAPKGRQSASVCVALRSGVGFRWPSSLAPSLEQMCPARGQEWADRSRGQPKSRCPGALGTDDLLLPSGDQHLVRGDHKKQ